MSKDRTMAMLIASTKESIHVAEESRKSKIIELMKTSVNNDQDNSADDQCLFNDYDTMKKKVPALVQMGVPITRNSIKIIARERAKLNREIKNDSL